MKFDDFVIQFSTMVLLACAAFFAVGALIWKLPAWHDAHRKRRQAKEFNLAASENVKLAAKTLVVDTDSPTPGSLVEVGWFLGPKGPTMEERLKILESRVTGVGCNFVNADAAISKRIAELERNACARADAIEAKLSKLTQASDALDHWIHKIEGRVESIENRLFGINKILDIHAEELRERPSVSELGPIASQLEKLHESLVSHARDIDRLDGRIDTLAKRRAPKKRAR